MHSRSFLILLLALAPFVTATAPGPFTRPPLDDATILATFDEVNGFDIETAQLAVVRGHSETVRRLAAEILRDHSMVLQMARDLAARTGIVYHVSKADDPSRMHADVMARLGRLNGAEFDEAFLKNDLAFHDGAVHAVREVLLPAATNPDLRALLTAVLPGFEGHLKMTRDVAKQLGVRVATPMMP